ncbi:MAG: esterase family protein [Armatimonadetes bacterium]|nr:esterase family protein [Armatimonadota bacterium]
MSFCQVNFFSPSLRKMMAMNIVLPESADLEGPFAVFYLLHGLSDDHSAWMRRTSIERYAQDYPLLVVMPDGGRSFYTDAVEGPAYESYMIRDVIGFVDRHFRTKATREGRAIGGLSMGGYGALKLALKHSDLFCSVNSHSGAPGFARRNLDPEKDAEFLRILGPNAAGGPEDIFALAERAERSTLSTIRIDCGTEDFLLEDNREFHAHLERIGIPHEYEEHPGAHNWAYWDTHVRTALEFHARNLGLEKQPTP